MASAAVCSHWEGRVRRRQPNNFLIATTMSVGIQASLLACSVVHHFSLQLNFFVFSFFFFFFYHRHCSPAWGSGSYSGSSSNIATGAQIYLCATTAVYDVAPAHSVSCQA
jgi:hypothetical protein